MTHSSELFAEAQKYLPGGVSRNTLLRSPHPFYAREGRGCRVIDVDGVERIDFANNMASLIHGHAHPGIVAAVTDQLQRGTAFTMGTEVEVRYARHLCGRAESFDQLRFVNSGTEAVMACLKAARAFTGRPLIAKVEGTYHGAYDYAEVSQAPAPGNWGDADRPRSVPLAYGTPESVLDQVLVLPFNNPEAAVALLDEHPDDIACVLVDPVSHRVGYIPAQAAFVEALSRWTRRHGALLIFDEVITFRAEVGGMQARFRVKPDLTALGKIIGGGFPVGAIAGREEVMGVFKPGEAGPRLPHSGTFSANPITMTAGLQAMELFDTEAVERLNVLGEQARQTLREAIATSGVPASVTGTASLFRVHMKPEEPTDYRSTFPTPDQAQALTRFVNGLHANGVHVITTGAGVLSTPMTGLEIEQLGEATLKSLRSLGAAALD